MLKIGNIGKLKPHVVAKHIEGRANNFKKPINISRSPCINQWYILTNRCPAWILCVTCWRNESTHPAPWNGYTKFKTSFYMHNIHYWIVKKEILFASMWKRLFVASRYKLIFTTVKTIAANHKNDTFLERTCDGCSWLHILCKFRQNPLKVILHVCLALCQTHCKQVPVISRPFRCLSV